MGNRLSFRKADSLIMHLLEVMTILGIPIQIKTGNGPAYISNKMKQFFEYYNIKHDIGISHSPAGQAIVERSNWTLMVILNSKRDQQEPLKKDYIVLY